MLVNYADWFDSKDSDDLPYVHQHPAENVVCVCYIVEFSFLFCIVRK